MVIIFLKGKVFLSGLILTAVGTILLYLNETTWCWMAQPGCPDNTSGPVSTLLVIAFGVSFSALAQLIAGMGGSEVE